MMMIAKVTGVRDQWISNLERGNIHRLSQDVIDKCERVQKFMDSFVMTSKPSLTQMKKSAGNLDLSMEGSLAMKAVVQVPQAKTIPGNIPWNVLKANAKTIHTSNIPIKFPYDQKAKTIERTETGSIIPQCNIGEIVTKKPLLLQAAIRQVDNYKLAGIETDLTPVDVVQGCTIGEYFGRFLQKLVRLDIELYSKHGIDPRDMTEDDMLIYINAVISHFLLSLLSPKKKKEKQKGKKKEKQEKDPVMPFTHHYIYSILMRSINQLHVLLNILEQ